MGGTDTVTVVEAQLIWKLSLLRQISIPKLMLQSLSHFRGRSNLVIPYGMWWTRIFRRYKVDFPGETVQEMSLHERDFLGATMLKRMHIDAAAYKAEMEAKEQAEQAEQETARGAQATGRGEEIPTRVEPGEEAQNAPRWYPGSWNDRIQGGDSWHPWDGARSNFETQASGHSHHAPTPPATQPTSSPQPQPDPAPTPTPNEPPISNYTLYHSIRALSSSMANQFHAVQTAIGNLATRLDALEHNPPTTPVPPTQPSTQHEPLSNRGLYITICGMQSQMMAQFQEVHSALIRVTNRVNALESNQNTLSAQIASLNPLPRIDPSSSHPPPS